MSGAPYLNRSRTSEPMQIKHTLLGLWLVGLLVGLPADATAATVDILASFRPDPSQPSRNVFKNHTPPGNSYCTWAPQYCNETRYSIGFPIDFRMNSAITPGGDDRNHILFHAPTERRNITVLHESTGEAETLQFRISGIGMMLKWIYPNPGPGVGWDTSWGYPRHRANTSVLRSAVLRSMHSPGGYRKVVGDVRKERSLPCLWGRFGWRAWGLPTS